ncbi:MAG TPA: Gfo/Idh/MocA family oxidoreductase [Gaiellales bacterium]|nr:Gfo/Idh/MocA family oxidoreductase [Gaiellales bacterium]
MTADLRLGMIGAGWIAERHLQSLAELQGASVAAVTDLDRGRAERVAATAGAAVYDDWRVMLDQEQLDAVMVLTPPLAHREPLEAAVARGLPTYLEKPVARTSEDSRAIIDAVRNAGAVVAVGYQYRALAFLPDLAAAASADPLGLLASHSVGATAGRPWFVQQAQSGGQVLERASHHIDLQRAIAGEVDWVQAAGSQIDLAGDQRPPGSDIDDVIALTLGFRSGALGTVLVAWTQPCLPSRYTLDLVSSRSSVRIELDPGFSAIGVRDGADVSLHSDAPPIQRGLERFLDAVRAGDPGLVACTVEQAAGTLEVALACERALADGGRVTVES